MFGSMILLVMIFLALMALFLGGLLYVFIGDIMAQIEIIQDRLDKVERE